MKMVSTLAQPEVQSVTTATTTITSLICAEPGNIEIKEALKMETVAVSALFGVQVNPRRNPARCRQIKISERCISANHSASSEAIYGIVQFL